MPLFKTKIGLIAATVGSAVGLGTVWRFPAEVQGNGGAAFLIVYIACVFLLGVPLMVSEFALGRGLRSDAVGVFRKQAPGTVWWTVGAGAVLASFLILCFYMVVGGWTLDYLLQSLDGSLFAGISPDGGAAVADTYFTDVKDAIVCSPLEASLFTAVFVGLNIVVLLGGVQSGIERMSNIAMPLLFVILLVFCVISLSLPGAGKGVEFFLTPDFSKITPAVCINALGQAMFSLSLAMGILITYASYYSNSTNLGQTAVIVSSLTLLVAIMMGLIIFPAVSAFGLQGHGVSGTTLVFVTLPEVFAALPFSSLWSALFFLLLMVAALTSTVSIAEVVICFLQERMKWSRRKAVLAVLLPLMVLASVTALSFGPLKDVKIAGLIMFDALDQFTNNIMLPLVALGTSLYVGWVAPKRFFSDQVTNDGMYKPWFAKACRFILKWVAPVAIITIFLTNIL